MSYQYPATPMQVLYQADPNVLNTLRSIRERIHAICNTYVNRYVRVQTLDGRVVEGIIVRCDHGHLYLWVSHRAYGPDTGTILTLVLYELLVITLLYT